jgi:hypothetical protein
VTGRARYEQAAKAGRRRTPADPQPSGVFGGPHVPAENAEMMRPCRTLTAGGRCGHTGYEHVTGTQAGRETRKACSVATAAGACGCTIYAPD